MRHNIIGRKYEETREDLQKRLANGTLGGERLRNQFGGRLCYFCVTTIKDTTWRIRDFVEENGNTLTITYRVDDACYQNALASKQGNNAP